MVFHRAILIRPTIESVVRADAVCVKENLHGSLRDACILFLFNVFIWNGIIHIVDGNVIVRTDSRHFPRCQLKRSWASKDSKKWLLFPKRRRPAAVSLLKQLAASMKVEITPTMPSTIALSLGARTLAGMTAVP